jgi:hypothetical protein
MVVSLGGAGLDKAGVMETVVREHLGTDVVASVDILEGDHFEDMETLSVRVHLSGPVDDEVSRRLFSLTRVLKDHLRTMDDDRFPIISIN